MIKLGDKEITLDQGANLVYGAGAAINGLSMLAIPRKSQNLYLKAEQTKNDANTRILGSALFAAGAANLAAGCNKDPATNKNQAKVTAVHNAIFAGLAISELAKPEGERVCKKNALIGATCSAGTACAVMAWRGFRKGGTDTLK
eukprot:TRINITY_DN11315_c0_g1_i4.p2 TRINITY_DN11315_c0_g1~~TRINITY_DN11315_c0_g1_i4.p2  ORF type:complete len:144 (-),score=15.80 TRINITY_DN11315_c0_g1_i4:395-826(-)